jgi:hypothetical protein
VSECSVWGRGRTYFCGSECVYFGYYYPPLSFAALAVDLPDYLECRVLLWLVRGSSGMGFLDGEDLLHPFWIWMREHSGPEGANVCYYDVGIVIFVHLQQGVHVLFVADFLL